MIEPLDQLQVAGERQSGIVADPMERGEKNAKAQAIVGHDRSPAQISPALCLLHQAVSSQRRTPAQRGGRSLGLQRSGRKNARISWARASGCSIAAKCPPCGMSVQRRMSV